MLHKLKYTSILFLECFIIHVQYFDILTYCRAVSDNVLTKKRVVLPFSIKQRFHLNISNLLTKLTSVCLCSKDEHLEFLMHETLLASTLLSGQAVKKTKTFCNNPSFEWEVKCIPQKKRLSRNSFSVKLYDRVSKKKTKACMIIQVLPFKLS